MGNFLKSWGWDYNPNRANAFRDIVFIVGAFFLGFWLMKSEDPFSKIVVSYCIASIIAGILFVIRLNVIYEQGCLMTIVWMAISPVIGVIYCPIMFVKAVRAFIFGKKKPNNK